MNADNNQKFRRGMAGVANRVERKTPKGLIVSLVHRAGKLANGVPLARLAR